MTYRMYLVVHMQKAGEGNNYGMTFYFHRKKSPSHPLHPETPKLTQISHMGRKSKYTTWPEIRSSSDVEFPKGRKL